MPGSQGAGGSPGGKKQSNHTHRPVTIRQLVVAFQPHPDAEFKIDDVDVEHVTFVGNITNMVRSATNASCSIEDGTGTIDVRLWMETADNDTGKLDGIEQGVYVRVIGNLKSFNNKRSLNAQVIRKVTDYNEIQYHMLEAIYVHLYHTRGPPPAAGQGGRPSVMQGISKPQQALQQRPGESAYANNAQASTSANNYSELKPLGRKIMMHIEKLGADTLPADGLAVDSITRAIPGAKLDAVQAEIEDLLGEGLLYTTSDSDHVLPTTI